MRLLGEIDRVDRVEWQSPLRAVEIERRLHAVGITGIGSLFAYRGALLCGRVVDGKISATRRGFRNSAWSPIFVGIIEDRPDGSAVYGEVRLHKAARLGILLGLLATSLFTAAMGVILASRGQTGWLGALALPIVVLLASRLFSTLAQPQWAFLSTTIGDAIEGVETFHERALT